MSRRLMISTDRSIFKEGSAVRARQVEYAKGVEELHIIVFTGPEFKEQSIAPNCWVYPTRSKSKWSYVLGATRLGRFIIEHRKITDISCQDPFLTGMAGVSLKRRFNLPLELQLHTDIGSPNFTYTAANKVRKFLAKSYLSKADSIRVVSNRIRDYLVTSLGIDSAKITVRPIAVDVDRIKNAPITVDLHKKYPQFRKIALMASRLEREKNIEMAIRAFKDAASRVTGAGLVVVGSGSEEGKLKQLVSSLNMNEKVVFEPWADSATLASYYKTADLFLVTSLFEGYGMTLVEAHAADCPTISTDVGIAREVGATIIRTDKELADQLVRFLSDK